MPRQLGLRTTIIVNLCILMGAALLFSGFLLLKLTEKAMIEQRIEAFVALLEGGSLVTTISLPDGTEEDDQPLRSARMFVEGLTKRFPIDQWFIIDGRFALYDFSKGETVTLNVDPDQFARVRNHGKPEIEIVKEDLKGSDNQGKTTIRVTVPLFTSEGFAGGMQVQTTFEDVKSHLAAFRQVLLIYLLLTGGILVLFGFFLLGRTVIRPIRALAEAAGKVAADRLETTVVPAGPVEIAELAHAFNAMTASLQRSREDALAHIEALERSGRELRQAQAELVRSEKLASVGRLSAGMAHEIGNPLGALIGYLEYLRREPAVPGEIIERTLYEARRIDRLVRDLLDYAAPEKTPPEPVDPAAVMEEARRVLENQGVFEGIKLHADLPPQLPSVVINRHKLMQVLVNLLLNARDAAPAGIITLAAGESGENIWLSVADNGTGMDEETAAKIFDPFFSTKDPGQGRGLGLTVCYHIVQEAGGSIDVTAAPGAGSTFRVRLPCRRG